MSEIKKTKNVVKTIFWSVMASFLGYIINFFVAPYITNNMGMDAYGFVTLTKTFVEYGALITTALNSYAVRYIGVEYHRGNFKKANIYFNSVLIADVVLSIVTVILAILFSLSIDYTLKVPPELFKDVQQLFVLCFFNFAITTAMTVFSSAAYLKNKIDINYIFRTIGYSAEILSLVLLFYCCETRLFFIGVSYIINSIIILLSRIWMTRKWTPELIINVHEFRFNSVKELVINGIWNSINSLGNILNTGLDMLVTNILLTATDLGVLGVVKTFPTMLVTLYQLVSQPFQPILLKAYSINDRTDLLKTLKMAMKSSGYITFLIYGGFVAIGRQFYQLWLPTQDSRLLYILTLIALLPNAIEGMIYPCYYIYTLCIKNKIPCLITIICGLLNVLGMYILIKYTELGIFSVLLTTVFAMAITSLITNPIYMARCLKISYAFFYKELLKGMACCLAMSFGMLCVAEIFVIDSWLKLALIVLLISIIGTVIYLVLMLEKNEKVLLITKIKVILRKRKRAN